MSASNRNTQPESNTRSRKSSIREIHPHPLHWKGGRINTRTCRAIGKRLQLRKQRVAEARRRAFLDWNFVIAHNQKVARAIAFAEYMGAEVNPSLRMIDAVPYEEQHRRIVDYQKELRRIG